jgi:hypothetical protein
MARKPVTSETHIGKDELWELDYNDIQKNIMNIKHPATLCEHSLPAFSSGLEAPLPTRGADCETDEEGNLMLIGFHDGKNDSYKPFNVFNKTPQEFVDWFADALSKMYMNDKNTCLVSWSELDGNVIYKKILDSMNWSDREKLDSMRRWGNVEGKLYTKEEEKEAKKKNPNVGMWNVQPILRTHATISRKKELVYNEDDKEWEEQETGKRIEFGILQAIQGSVCFYLLPENSRKLQKIWLFDISTLTKGSLEDSANEFGISYKKAPEEFHVIDWDKYNNDKNYRFNCLKSNRDDAKAAKEIADCISDHYAEIFKFTNLQGMEIKRYPSGFWSVGSLTTFALGMMMNKNDRASINWIEQLKDFVEVSKHSQEDVMDLSLHAFEAYKAGLIDNFRIGNGKKKKIFTSDMSSAYPFIMSNLFDPRGAIITRGEGRPDKPEKHEYLFVRGKANVSDVWGFHTIGMKEPRWGEATVRPAGEFKATALYQEWEMLERDGEEVEYISWVKVTTTGKSHPLVKVIHRLWEKRMYFETMYKRTKDKKYKNFADAVKLVMNSIYGKTFEAVRKFADEIVKRENEIGETEENEMLFMKGFKTGAYFNIILATVITGFTRIRICEMLKEIQKNGGKPILAMTDAIYWEGTGNELPKHGEYKSILGDYSEGLEDNGWTEEKTLGTWTKPEQCFDFICLGTGRYEYKTASGEKVIKIMGMMLNVLGFEQEAHTDKKKPIYESLESMLKIAIKKKTRASKDHLQAGEPCLIAKQRILGTPQYCVHKGDPSLLGQIKEEDIEMIITRTFPKRKALPNDLTHEAMINGFVDTWAPRKEDWVETHFIEFDGTLPILREKIKEMELIAYETTEIKEERAKLAKAESNAKRDRELKLLAQHFGMSKKALKDWRTTLTDREKGINGIDEIRKIAEEEGFDFTRI